MLRRLGHELIELRILSGGEGDGGAVGFDGLEDGEGGAETDAFGGVRIGEDGFHQLERGRGEGVVAIEDVGLVALAGGVEGCDEFLVISGPFVNGAAVNIEPAGGVGDGGTLEEEVEGLELDGR